VVKGLFRGAPPAVAAARIAGVEDLPVGGGATFFFPAGSTPRLLIRTGPSTFVAYDQQCTHLLCPVVPAVDQGRIHCPCHNGWFDLETGRPVAGPPQRPLPRVTLEVRGGDVYATGVEETRS
jgi:Rieske Fe-S protein